MPGLTADTASDTSIGDLTSAIHKFTAKHGGFTASADLANSHTSNAMAIFMHGIRTSCVASTIHQGTKYGAIGLADGLFVRVGPKPLVDAFTIGKQHHHYRVVFTLRTKAGVQHRTLVRTAKGGLVQAAARDLKHLPSFTKVSVTITDLTQQGAPQSFTLQR